MFADRPLLRTTGRRLGNRVNPLTASTYDGLTDNSASDASTARAVSTMATLAQLTH
tara:strand:- start:1597 stop:1764 length:168 start_codon:yes stop_codon:yes gene_type:complete